MKVVVTGGAGRLGQLVIRELQTAGHAVLSLDRVPLSTPLCPAWVADLTRAGDLYQALRGADGVIHLAAWQAPNLTPDTETFANNVSATYNVLQAAHDLGIDRVVLASSVAAYGYIYAPRMPPPEYLPLDEAHPCIPQDPYGLSKLVGEQIADAFVRLRPMQIASLRLAGINFDLAYERFAERWRTPTLRLGGFWSYVDGRVPAGARSRFPRPRGVQRRGSHEHHARADGGPRAALRAGGEAAQRRPDRQLVGPGGHEGGARARLAGAPPLGGLPPARRHAPGLSRAATGAVL